MGLSFVRRLEVAVDACSSPSPGEGFTRIDAGYLKLQDN